jgi:DnaK suppressor protein
VAKKVSKAAKAKASKPKVKAKQSKPVKKAAKAPAPKSKPVKAKATATAEPKQEKPKSEKKKATKAVEPVREEPKAEAAKPARKGITIVSQKPVKKAKSPSAAYAAMPAGLGRLLDPKGPARKPLIPSGPKAVVQRPLGQHGGVQNDQPRPVAKTPFSKKELEHFRNILLAKRRELVGDISTMESQALRGQSGALSNMPQHLAEQGSEAYDQALSLDLAAADRKLIREIDDALARIADGTYGICEMSGKPIKVDRLEELPWARYSIEAARELERQSMRG